MRISTARLFGVTLTIDRILKGDAVNTILRSKACRYAIKFGDKLSDYDMKLLVRQSFSKCKKRAAPEAVEAVEAKKKK